MINDIKFQVLILKLHSQTFFCQYCLQKCRLYYKSDSSFMQEYCISTYFGVGLYLAILAVRVISANSKHRQFKAPPFLITVIIL